MATIKLVIEVPNYTAAELQHAISMVDSLEDETPISPEFVTGFDVLGAVYAGQFGLDQYLHASDKGHMKIVTNEIED